MASLSEAKLQLVAANANQSAAGSQADDLVAKLRAPASIHGLLSGVKVAEDLNSALTIKDQLANNESVVTKDGIWLSANWIRVSRQSQNEAGLVEREAELKELVVKLEQQEELLEQNEAAEAELREQISTMEDSWQQRQRELRDANKRYSELRAKVGSQQAKLEQTRQRIDKLA